MKIKLFALILAATQITNTHAEMDIFDMADSYVGFKVAQVVNQGINSTKAFSDINLKIEKPMNYGAYLSAKTIIGIGFELDYMANAATDVSVDDKVVGSISSSRSGMYLTGYYDISEMFYLKAKLGYLRHISEVESNITNEVIEFKEGGLGVGGGFGVNITKSIGVLAEYDYANAGEKTSQVGVGVHLKL